MTHSSNLSISQYQWSNSSSTQNSTLLHNFFCTLINMASSIVEVKNDFQQCLQDQIKLHAEKYTIKSNQQKINFHAQI